jgi:hypothetical protein
VIVIANAGFRTKLVTGLARASAYVAVALFGVACLPAYKPPTADQPHAVVKLRRVYENHAGTHLEELVAVNDHRALSETSLAQVSAARTDAILAHPEPASWEVRGTFYHTEQKYVREPYYVQEPYSTTESYNCGTMNSYRTCSRSVTRYRSVTKYRNVWKTVRVNDAACSASIAHVPRQDAVYLLQYTYQTNRVCNLRCYEQRGDENVRCDTAPQK